MPQARLFLAVAAVTLLAAGPASAQIEEFVVRVPEPNFVMPGLEANPQAEVDIDANLPAFRNDTRLAPRLSRSQRRRVAAQCRAVLDNPRAYSRDAVSLCRSALD